MAGRPVALNLTETGGAELLDAAGNTVWASSSDEEFAEYFPEFLNERDLEDLGEYLLEEGMLTEEELERLEVGEWSLDDESEGEED